MIALWIFCGIVWYVFGFLWAMRWCLKIADEITLYDLFMFFLCGIMGPITVLLLLDKEIVIYRRKK